MRQSCVHRILADDVAVGFFFVMAQRAAFPFIALSAKGRSRRPPIAQVLKTHLLKLLFLLGRVSGPVNMKAKHCYSPNSEKPPPHAQSAICRSCAQPSADFFRQTRWGG